MIVDGKVHELTEIVRGGNQQRTVERIDYLGTGADSRSAKRDFRFCRATRTQSRSTNSATRCAICSINCAINVPPRAGFWA